MTVVDSFSKMAIFVPLVKTDAQTVAREFFTHIVATYGLPKVLVSDRDPRFTGNFWKTLMQQFRTDLHFTTAFHPQTDGMAEVTNRTLSQLLRTHCQDSTNWRAELPYLQMIYNATPQSRTRLSPYKLATGRDVLLPIDLAVPKESVPASQNFAEGLATLWQSIRQKMTALHQQEKVVADRSRREAGITVGQQVMLSTKNLQLKSVSGKMKPRFVGPFRVCELIGSNAAKLELPPSMSVHPTFNVSLLKIYKGKLQRPGPVEVEGQEEFEIEKIIAHRRSRGRIQYLVRWKGYDESEDMWLVESRL